MTAPLDTNKHDHTIQNSTGQCVECGFVLDTNKGVNEINKKIDAVLDQLLFDLTTKKQDVVKTAHSQLLIMITEQVRLGRIDELENLDMYDSAKVHKYIAPRIVQLKEGNHE